MYSLWFYLTFNIAIGFVDKSKGINQRNKIINDTGLLARINAKINWILELIDYVKDWMYLFLFKHLLIPFLILAFSLSFPFALHD